MPDDVENPVGDRTREAQQQRQGDRRRRLFGWSMLAAGVLVLAASGWVGWRVYSAYSHLTAASADVSALQEQVGDVTAIDTAATAETVSHLQGAAADARSAAEDPLVRLAATLPWVGPNLNAVRDIAVTADGLARDVMPSMVEVVRNLDPAALAPKGGAFDLAPIQRAAPLLQAANAQITESRVRIGAIERADLVGPVDDAVVTLAGKLQQASGLTEAGARTARLLPAMLGATGTRTYLVAFQNPAEPRATGGIFGSYAVVEANQGRVSILNQGAPSRTLGYFKPPVAEVEPNEVVLYSDLLTKYPQDVNLTPDFPTAAGFFAQMHAERTGVEVDGVLATDPVALSYLLRATGPVPLPDGAALTTETVVPFLLSTAYEKFADDRDQEQRDAYLANATALAFGAVMSGSGEPGALLKGLQRAANERRTLIWSRDDAEQADLAATELAGAMDQPQEAASIGVFLNSGSASKMGYYLRNAVTVTPGECVDGRRALKVTVTMDFDAPADGLPAYVTGKLEPGEPYAQQTNVLIFAPAGGRLLDAVQDDAPMPMARGGDFGREAGTVTVRQAPGDRAQFTFRILDAPRAAGGVVPVEPGLVVTPGVQPWDLTVPAYASCTSPAR